MTLELIHFSLLATYLNGTCSDEEKAQVDEWLREDPRNRRVLQDMARLWDLASEPVRNGDLPETARDWSILRHRMEESDEIETRIPGRTRKRFSLHSFPAVIMRYSAIFVMALLLGGMFVKGYQDPAVVAEEPALREVSMARGQRGNITLSDGTHVVLNADSRITFPTNFGSTSREVTLVGEAFFDVARDKDRPFRIRVNGALVEVLGTSFAIRSYPGDPTVRTVVKEGLVEVRPDEVSDGQAVRLARGMLAHVDLGTRSVTTGKVEDLALYVSWTDGYLKFRNTPLGEVAAQLQRKYDVQIEFEDDSLRGLDLTAELKSRSIDHILEVLSTSLGVDAAMVQDTVRIGRRTRD